MHIEKKLKIIFWVSAACMLLMSCSFLLMPFASDMAIKGNNLYTIISGLMFWVPLLAGYGLLITVNIIRRRQTKCGRNKNIKSYGVLKILSNKWAAVADAGFVIAIIGLVFMMFFRPENYVTFVFISLSLFAFNMHCFLNGENFKYVLSERK